MKRSAAALAFACLALACGTKHGATTGTSSSSTTSTTGAGGAGGTNDAWKLLYDGTPEREPSAITLLPNEIVVEVASDTPGPNAALATLPYSGGTLSDTSTLSPLLSSDTVALATDDASIGILERFGGGDQLETVPAIGGTPADLIPASAMKRAHPLVAVHAGRVYFVDDAGIESIATGGQPTSFVAMPVAVTAASESHAFFLSGSAIYAVPFTGGAPMQVADEAMPVIAMAASDTHVYWLEDAGDAKHSTVFGADIGGTGARMLGTGEFHAIAADPSGVYAFFFDGDEQAILERIDPSNANTTSIDSPFATVSTVAVRPDVPYIVVLGTVLAKDSSGAYAYHRQVRVLPKQ